MNFDSIVSKAKDGLEIVRHKAEETAEITKLKFEMAALKTKISKAYENLGKIYYEATKKGETPDEVYTKPIVEDISAKRKNMGELARKIKEIKGE